MFKQNCCKYVPNTSTVRNYPVTPLVTAEFMKRSWDGVHTGKMKIFTAAPKGVWISNDLLRRYVYMYFPASYIFSVTIQFLVVPKQLWYYDFHIQVEANQCSQFFSSFLFSRSRNLREGNNDSSTLQFLNDNICNTSVWYTSVLHL